MFKAIHGTKSHIKILQFDLLLKSNNNIIVLTDKGMSLICKTDVLLIDEEAILVSVYILLVVNDWDFLSYCSFLSTKIISHLEQSQ